MAQTLPTGVDGSVEYEDFYESTLDLPLTASGTDIYPATLPMSAAGFLVIDAKGTAPEIIYYNEKGLNYVRCPSATDGQGRGVFNTTPGNYDAGTTIGMYSIAAFFEGIVTGNTMRDGFIQSRHFSSSLNPNAWIGGGDTFTYGANQGNNVATYVVASDVTSKYGRGTKLRLPRVTTVATQCASLSAASSQYASRASASITGLSFTDDFTIEAWVKPTANGHEETIVARRESNQNGFQLRLGPTGKVELLGFNAGNYRFGQTIQSIPYGEWTHVAATLDMSGVATTMYINGAPVPATVVSSGSPSSLAQGSGDLIIGAYTGGKELFTGKISDVRVWNTIRTANQIKGNMNTTLVGNESNLILYYKLTGNFNDSASSANTLTAQGGAAATNADYPFVATEYGMVIDATYTSGNTTISVFTGKNNTAPAENLTNVAYSYSRTPPGFNAAEGNWDIDVIIRSTQSISGPTAGTWYNVIGQVSVPVGDWELDYQASLGAYKLSSTAINVKTTLSTANNSESEPLLTATVSNEGPTGTISTYPHISRHRLISQVAQATWYLNMSTTTSGASALQVNGADAPSILTAHCPYV